MLKCKKKKKNTIHFLAHSSSQLLGSQKEKVNFEKKEKKHNDIIAGNGRILKVYMFIVWLYLFKNILR